MFSPQLQKSMFSPQLQAYTYVENVLYYRCFSRNLAKIYRTAIFSDVCEAKTIGVLTQWCLGSFNAGCSKRTCIPKQTCNSQLKVCLSMYDVLLPSGIKGLKGVLEIFSHNQIKSEAYRLSCSLKKTSESFQKIPRKKSVTELIFSIFASLQVGKYAKYCDSPNKLRTSDKCRISKYSAYQNRYYILLVAKPKCIWK